MIENIQPILVQKGKFPLITSNDIKIYVVPFCYIPTRTNLVSPENSESYRFGCNCSTFSAFGFFYGCWILADLDKYPHNRFKITELCSQRFPLAKLCKYFHIHQGLGNYGLVF